MNAESDGRCQLELLTHISVMRIILIIYICCVFIMNKYYEMRKKIFKVVGESCVHCGNTCLAHLELDHNKFNGVYCIDLVCLQCSIL